MRLKPKIDVVDQLNVHSLLFNLHYTVKKEVDQPGTIPAAPGLDNGTELDSVSDAARVMNYLCEQDQFVRKNYLKFKMLSKREKEIIKLIVDGQSSYCISAKLFLSVHTVNNHRKNIGKKLDVRSISELIKFAIAFFII
jgi:DNA-binding CsgD family transcriptional regulator